ncbi:transposase [Streptomyces sp. CMB-StM0423]|uniref:transposase n=1 Tax=Streptomyces sp. CMB-StM0423 TaxID=2059884 RepID=UPI0018FEF045
MGVGLSQRLVPDDLWSLVAPLLPSFPSRPQGGGTAPVDERAVFTAVVYVLTSGCAWRHLPETFGVSPATAHRRFTDPRHALHDRHPRGHARRQQHGQLGLAAGERREVVGRRTRHRGHPGVSRPADHPRVGRPPPGGPARHQRLGHVGWQVRVEPSAAPLEAPVHGVEGGHLRHPAIGSGAADPPVHLALRHTCPGA